MSSDDAYTYLWGIEEHNCSKEDVIHILTSNAFDFEHNEDDEHVRCFETMINDWKAMKVRVEADGSIRIALHWMGDTTNERYYDYLIQCAHLSGQLVEALQVRHDELTDAFERFCQRRGLDPETAVGDLVDAYHRSGV